MTRVLTIQTGRTNEAGCRAGVVFPGFFPGDRSGPARSLAVRRLEPSGDSDPASLFAPWHGEGTAWSGWLSYELGRRIESRAGTRPSAPTRHPSGPLAELHRVDLAGPPAPCGAAGAASRPRLRSEQGRERYMAGVRRALEYIRAGDVYQVNLAHRLSGAFSGSATALYGALARGARPRHGLCVVSRQTDGRGLAVLSLSPELFLSFDARTRRLVTRPMKGTRPGDGDAEELRGAEKDRAELTMIVDLMRNDLGRVCEFGSVRVDVAREIERHGSGRGAVLQATATVAGIVRERVGTAEILGATFPPGSVTGAPKIRAMQIIDELEPFERGPYCGCAGTFHDDGSFELGVSIRTVVIEGPLNEKGEFVGAELSYCVGAGIVADSDPECEWLETLDKARVLEPVCEVQED